VRTPEGLEFLIGTGFSDAQRAQPPATGTVVTFTHRGFTAAGLPRFASFLRERSV
jgi:DNA ligase 1